MIFNVDVPVIVTLPVPAMVYTVAVLVPPIDIEPVTVMVGVPVVV
jgi:hypothetical protein